MEWGRTYYFSITIVINCHKVGGQKFVGVVDSFVSCFTRLEDVSRAVFFLEAYRRICFLAFTNF